MAMKKKAKARPKSKMARKTLGKLWRADELKRLREGYKTKPASRIAKELRRSLASVRGKISALNLRKPSFRRAKGKR